MGRWKLSVHVIFSALLHGYNFIIPGNTSIALVAALKVIIILIELKLLLI